LRRTEPGRKPDGRGRRLLWFAALYALSAAAFAALTYALRALVPH
jgi:hypothetical protein